MGSDGRTMKRAFVMLVPLLSLLALSLLAGCNLVFGVQARPSNRCSADSTCEEGTCDAELGICVSEPEEPYRFAIAVTLPADDTVGRPRLTANLFESASTGMAPLVVPSPVRVDGTVRTTTEVVEADLLFSRHETRVGAPIAPLVVSTTPPLEERPLERENDFATELFPGTYDVLVRPRSEHAGRFPPYRFRAELTSPSHLSIEVPELETYRRLAGWVVDTSGEGQDGLEVRAIEVMTGRVVSSVALTATEGEQAGAFSLNLDPNAERWVLQVTAPACSPSVAVSATDETTRPVTVSYTHLTLPTN